jgi:hypothetical protein
MMVNPKTRKRIGQVLLVLGVALLVAAPVLHRFGPKWAVRQPAQVNEQLFLTGTGAFLEANGFVLHQNAPIQVSNYVTTACVGRDATSSKSTATCPPGQVGSGNTAVWDQRIEVSGLAGTRRVLVNVMLDRVAFDRRTGAAVPGYGQPHVHGDAQVFFFPFGTQKQTYSQWDVVSAHAEPARYVGTTRVSGMTAYEFLQQPRVDLGNFTPDGTVPGSVLGRPDEASVPAHLDYSNDRRTFVDPRTGTILNETDDITLTARALDGRGDLATVLTAPDLTMRPQDQAFLASEAVRQRHRLDLVGRTIPIGLALGGAVALAAGLVLTLRRPKLAEPPRSVPVPPATVTLPPEVIDLRTAAEVPHQAVGPPRGS